MSELATLFTGPDAYPWFIRHAPIPPSVDCPVSLWLRLPGRKCFTSASRHQEACGGQRAVAQLVSMMHAVPAPSCPQADAGCREDVANESVGITRGSARVGEWWPLLVAGLQLNRQLCPRRAHDAGAAALLTHVVAFALRVVLDCRNQAGSRQRTCLANTPGGRKTCRLPPPHRGHRVIVGPPAAPGSRPAECSCRPPHRGAADPGARRCRR